MDMHSGGGTKEAWEYIYIEAPEEEAKLIFYNMFGHSPERVSCTCCGEDYSISDYPSLKGASAYDRNCRAIETKRGDDPILKAREGGCYLEENEVPPDGYTVSSSPRFREYVPFDEWLTHAGETTYTESFRLINEADIQPKLRQGIVPEQGYVWRD